MALKSNESRLCSNSAANEALFERRDIALGLKFYKIKPLCKQKNFCFKIN